MPEQAWADPHTWAASETVSSIYLNQSQNDLIHLRQRGDRTLTLGGATNAVAGMVLRQDTSAADSALLISTAGYTGHVWVALQAITAAAAGYCRAHGLADVYTTDAVAAGDSLQTSTTAGEAAVGSTAPFAVALTAKASGAGTVVALLHPRRALVAADVGLTTLGDLLYRDASALARLAGNTTATRKFLRQVGDGAASAAPAWDTLAAADLAASPGEGKRLAYIGGVAAWTSTANVSAFHAYRTGSQTHSSSGAFVQVQLNTEAHDNLSEFDPTTNFRFAAAEAGLYLVAGGAILQSVSTGTRVALSVFVNGSEKFRLSDLTTAGASDVELTGCVPLLLAATNTVDLRVYHTDTDASISIAGGAGFTYLTGLRVA